MSETGAGDDLIKDGNENLDERVGKLEKKCFEQENEIICLKSGLGDALRRLNQLEVNSANSHGAQTRPNKLATKRPVSSTIKQSSAHHDSASRNERPSPQTRQISRTTSREPKTNNKSNVKTYQAAENSPNNSHGSSKSPSWHPDGGYLKIYLKGRPIFLYAPSLYNDYEPTKEVAAPSDKLKLEWVYGYRGRDCRSNVYYLPTGEIVYFVAATAILFNPDEGSQRHYTGHNDDIKCLAVHPDRTHIATGQVAGHDKKEARPHVRMWHSVTLATVHIIGFGEFERAVACISFSKLDGGKHLVAVDESNDHNISVWEISNKVTKVTSTKSSQDAVLAVEYHPQENNCIISCGKNHIAFWSFDGTTLNKKFGLYDKYEKPKYMLCIAFNDDGEVLSGDSSGNIYVWKKTGNTITRSVIAAHDGGVFSLTVTPDGKILSGGGKDRKIIEWDNELKKTGLETELQEQYGGVRVIALRRGNMILVGTTKNYIMQGPSDFNINPIVFGHTDELWGLAMHPSHHQFLTCGYDKHVFMWDALSHTVVWGTELTDSAHSCCFHPKVNIAAVGLQNGNWLILDLTSRDVASTHTDGNEQIEAIQYSPNGQLLAIGSRDNSIYIYKVSDDETKHSRLGKCSGHSSFITHIDWSADSMYVRSNSGDYELLYWVADDCKQEPNSDEMKDIQWASQTCTLDFTVAGIWPHGADGSDINACARSKNQLMCVSADDFGKVNLYSYPCSQPKATPNSYRGHSSHVTNVVFTPDDARVITTGGKDTAVLQWAVV